MIILALTLLLAGDIESNPGPSCDFCSKTIRKDYLGKAFTCTAMNCVARCHTAEKCSKISRWSQEQPQWFCREHSDDNVQEETVAPAIPVTQNATCNYCKAKIKIGIVPLPCSTTGCEEVCHSGEKCSKISRWKKEKRWTCGIHNGTAASNTDEVPRREAVPAAEAQAEAEPILEADVGPAEKLKCGAAKCGGLIRTKPTLICCKCKKPHHKQLKCSGQTRVAVEEILSAGADWTCKKCEEQRERDYSIPTLQGNTISEKINGESRQSLKILQWNADGLNTKMLELRKRLIDEDIDVCNIQETKFQPKISTPKIPGYKPTKRADRGGGIQGGGLITYVKETVIFDNGQESSLDATESTTTRVQLNKKSWVTISNVYTPPTNSVGQNIAFSPVNIPTSAEPIITGDLNGHSPLWDLIQPTDVRGEEIEDWCLTAYQC